MRLISAGNHRFTRSYDYSLPELKPSSPRASRRISMVTPGTHTRFDSRAHRQEERR
jgi:hypothetical protein